MPSNSTQANTAAAVSTNRDLLARVLGPSTFVAFRSLVRLGRDDWGAAYPLRNRINAWRRGFYAHSYLIYDLKHNNPNDYIDDFAWAYRCSRLNTVSLFYFRHKLAFRSVLLHAGVPQPETVAVVAHDRILLHPLRSDSRYVLPHEFERVLLEDGGCFVVKPEAGNHGDGIFLLRAGETGLVRQRGRSCEPFKTTSLPSVALIERLVSQGSFWNTLFPGSGNSIRVLTGWMPGEPQPFIIRAVQRIGTVHTVPTDNWSAGGLCALVDLETGRLGPGRVNPIKSKYPNRRYELHPDSHAQIEGAVLPGWNSIRQAVIRACASSPLHRYVGWDVIVDDKETPVIVEGNGNSGLGLIQVHGGLLADPAAKRFYQTYRVI